jgi:spermidine synthase
MNAPATSTPTEPLAAPSLHAGARTINIALAATAALSAWLIFQVQPMVAKRILPWFGGGTAVWTTVMLFFQSALFIGYLYAHLATRWFTPSRQVRLHVALLAAAAMLAAILGVLPSGDWRPASGDQPARHILVMLAASVGLPYLMLAATAPLTQVWFAGANPGKSPYRLYALSNAGSLAALLSYPFIFEPRLGVAGQGVAWAALFVLFALLCAASGLASLRSLSDSASSVADAQTGSSVFAAPLGAAARPAFLERFFWLALPAVASVALLAITTHLCQDVLSIPLLWIAPMVVYLLSFILTFDSDRWYRRSVWFPVGALSSFAAAIIWSRGSTPFGLELAIDLTLLAAICMICHGELARQRPETSRLTAFYLNIAAGGAIGGLLCGVAAPLLLAGHYELQLSVIASWLLAFAAIVTDGASPYFDGGKGRVFASLLGMVALWLGLCLAFYLHFSQDQLGVIVQRRNFYGVLKVTHIATDEGSQYYDLANGRISHGAQFLEAENRRVPMSYYHADSGVGRMLIDHDANNPRRVGVIGLGTGTIAAYAGSGETFRFYDVNPQVFKFADEHFSYLQDARDRGAKIELIEGDARIALESEPAHNFDLLVLDAFNGDSIPAHLLTLESFKLYLNHLKAPDGVLAVHISNRHLDLSPVVKAAADRFQLDAVIVEVPRDDTPATAGSTWVLLSRQPGRFEKLGIGMPLATYVGKRSAVTWTDDYSSLLDVLDMLSD